MQLERNNRPRVVVTGLGAQSPLGGVDDFWENLKAGKSGIRRISLFDPQKLEVQVAGEVNFDPSDHIDRKSARRMSRASQLTLAAARMGDDTNPDKASSGSQFYIVQGRIFSPDMLNAMANDRSLTFTPQALEAYTSIGGTPHLDGSYTVFGEVVEGLDVLDLIASQPTDSHNRPLEDVIFSISLIK